jgi:hypothetical protein
MTRIQSALRSLALLASSITIAFAEDSKHTYMPPGGYVPDSRTAIKITVAIWEPIYGAAQLAREKPYHATLRDGVWTVTGSLPERTLGDVAIAEISKQDGRILRVSHFK